MVILILIVIIILVIRFIWIESKKESNNKQILITQLEYDISILTETLNNINTNSILYSQTVTLIRDKKKRISELKG